jgi:MinD-like ATPase involved in chromosome partitioning or flagellar assembly
MGGKGGVGKTLSLVTLIEALKIQDKAFALVDSDRENENAGGISHFFPDATAADLRDKATIDALLEAAAEIPLTLVDLPANASGDFMGWFQEATEPEVLNELNIEIYAIGVVTPEVASWQSVAKWADALKKNCKYVIVLNHLKESRVEKTKEQVFDYYFQSKGRPKIGAIAEVEIPGLYDGSRSRWQDVGGPLSEIVENKSVPVLDRSRLRKFLNQTVENWQPFVEKL